MASMNIKSGDTVQVVVGNEDSRGKRGKVIVVDPENHRVVVEGLNLVTKHKKPRSAQEQGGRFEQPRMVDVSNVMLVCPKCNQPTRVNHVLGDNGKYLRSCHKCGAVIDARAEKKQTRTAKNKASARKSKKSTSDEQ